MTGYRSLTTCMWPCCVMWKNDISEQAKLTHQGSQRLNCLGLPASQGKKKKRKEKWMEICSSCSYMTTFVRFSHLVFLVPQPSGAEAQRIVGNKGVHTERLQRRNRLPLPDQVPLRARQQGEHKHKHTFFVVRWRTHLKHLISLRQEE